METKTLDEYDGPPRTTGPPAKSGVLSGHIGRSSGAWIWFVQRVAAVTMLVIVVLHLHAPHARRIQFALLAVLLVHAAAGVPVLLIEYGRVDPKHHSALFGVCLGLSAVVFVLVYLRLL